MPKRIVYPADSARTADVDSARGMIGNWGRIEIIRYLNRHGPARRGDIVDAVTASEASVAKHLIWLENSGVIIVDTLRGQRHGRAPRYSTDVIRVKELMETFGDYLGLPD